MYNSDLVQAAVDAPAFSLTQRRLIECRASDFLPPENMPVDENWLVWVSQCSQAPEPHKHQDTYNTHTHTPSLVAHSVENCQPFRKTDKQTVRLRQEEKGQTSSIPATTDRFRCSVKCCISSCVCVCVCLRPGRAVTATSCTVSVHRSKRVNPFSNSNTHAHSSATETRSSRGREEWSEGGTDGWMDGWMSRRSRTEDAG